jgi:hypothetical protein
MLCCVSPAGKNVSESKNSLMYANRARNIQNKAVINRDEQSSIVAELQRQVQLLQEELFAFRHPGANLNDPKVQAAASEWHLDSFGSLRARTEGAEQEVLRLTSELKRWRSETDAIKEELLATQTQRDYFRMCCEEMQKNSSLHSSQALPLVDIDGTEMSIVKEQLRTIQELQTTLRQAELDRDRAHLWKYSSTTSTAMAFHPHYSHHHETESVNPMMSSFDEFMSPEVLQEEQRLMELAAEEIKRETDILKQLQQETTRPPPPPSSVTKEILVAPAPVISGATTTTTRTTVDPVVGATVAVIDDDMECSRPATSVAVAGGGDHSTEPSETPAAENHVQESCNESASDEHPSCCIVVPQQHEEMKEMQRAFQERQNALGQTVEDLSNTISLKEQMLQTLRRNVEGYERMRGVFEQKLAEMAEKERHFMAEREKLLCDMQVAHQTKDPPRYEKLSNDLQSKDVELSALRKKQAEMKRFETMKQKSDVQLRVLTNEITVMKKQKVDLIKKMQTERKKYEQEAEKRTREITNLKRTHQRDRQQILKLGSEKEAQERVLKRRMEEVAAANRRLKQQQLLIQSSKNHKQHHNTRQKPSQSSHSTNKSSQDEEWLAAQIKKLADQQKKAELLEKELEKREKIVQQMERLYGMRSKLQEELQASLTERKVEHSSNIRDILISPLKAEAPGLSREEEAMLVELEERIEACQAQLEYKDERISEMASSSVDMDLEEQEAIVKMENSSLPEARTLLKLLFGMAVNVKKQEEAK